MIPGSITLVLKGKDRIEEASFFFETNNEQFKAIENTKIDPSEAWQLLRKLKMHLSA